MHGKPGQLRVDVRTVQIGDHDVDVALANQRGEPAYHRGGKAEALLHLMDRDLLLVETRAEEVRAGK